MIRFSPVTLPDFGRSERVPELPPALYRARLEAAADRLRQTGLDALVVYADREHASNLAYLTGFDPRFEEAVLLLAKDGRRKLLVGNECMGYLPSAELGIEIEMYQDFSLMGQPRQASRTLRQIFQDFGLAGLAKIGCAGWKTQSAAMAGLSRAAIEIPAYLVDLLRELASTRDGVLNANDLFMANADGLRTINEPEQIAFFEHAAGITSDAMRLFFKGLKPGVRENEIAGVFDPGGLPLACHSMTSFGEKAKRGLSSPSDAQARLGDTYTVAFAVIGSLTSRAGCVAASATDLPENLRSFYERFVKNYFAVVTAWYESIKVGATGGAVFAKTEKQRDPSLYHFAVNTGHLIHLDEWLNSPFAANSTETLKSGMALQMDIIPVSDGPFCYANMEDGVVLADAELRATLAARYPQMWARIQRRREFMRDVIGIRLDASVLPLSNMPAWLPPYALDTKTVLVNI